MAATLTEPKGPALWNGIRGAFNDITANINFNPSKAVRIRPELRYDWQSGNYRHNAFGQGNPNGHTHSSQVTAAVDLVLFY